MDQPAASRSRARARGRPKSWADKTEQNTIKSLDRAMEVLEHLSTLPGATLSELANSRNQSAATIYRVLVTLAGRGLVEFDPQSQRWHIGPQAFVIGARYLRRSSLMDRAAPILRQLMERTSETANLAVPREGAVVFIGQAECHHSIRAFFPPGSASPLHASGIGKALLAQMGPDEAARALGVGGPEVSGPEASGPEASGREAGALEAFTAHTITTPAALMAELTRTRARGYALDDQEKNLGMRCIAAAVTNWAGEPVAGLSISGPIARIGDADIPRLADAVMDAARQLSSALGAGSAPG